MFLNSLLANKPASENNPIGDKSFIVLLILLAIATRCTFCACLAFVATKGKRPITLPAPWTNPDSDTENTFIGIPSSSPFFAASFAALLLTPNTFPKKGLT